MKGVYSEEGEREGGRRRVLIMRQGRYERRNGDRPATCNVSERVRVKE